MTGNPKKAGQLKPGDEISKRGKRVMVESIRRDNGYIEIDFEDGTFKACDNSTEFFVFDPITDEELEELWER